MTEEELRLAERWAGTDAEIAIVAEVRRLLAEVRRLDAELHATKVLLARTQYELQGMQAAAKNPGAELTLFEFKGDASALLGFKRPTHNALMTGIDDEETKP